MNFKSFILNILGRGPYSEKRLLDAGVKVGRNVYIGTRKIDLTHGFLLEIGNNVTLSDCRILLHDASTKMFLGYSKVGKVIIGAGTIVTKDIPDNSVVVGNPGRVVSSCDAYIEKNRKLIQLGAPVYTTYATEKTCTEIEQMQRDLNDGRYGFDI